MRIDWKAGSVLAVIGIAFCGGVYHLGSEVGRLEGQLHSLSPASVEKLKAQLASELNEARNTLDELAENAEEKLAEADEAIATRVAEAVSATTNPPVRQWCSAIGRREFGEWYDGDEHGMELSVTVAPEPTDDKDIFRCGLAVNVRNPHIYRLITTVGGTNEARYGSAFQCAVTSVTIPRYTEYQVVKVSGGATLGWLELRPECPEVAARVKAFQDRLRSD